MTTPQDVAQALADKMPGRVNDLPTPIQNGTRVAIHFFDVGADRTEIAHGTVGGSYGTGDDATSLVVLDTTLTMVDVPWSMLRRP